MLLEIVRVPVEETLTVPSFSTLREAAPAELPTVRVPSIWAEPLSMFMVPMIWNVSPSETMTSPPW